MVKSFEGDHQTDEVGEGQEACECSDTFHFSWEKYLKSKGNA